MSSSSGSSSDPYAGGGWGDFRSGFGSTASQTALPVVGDIVGSFFGPGGGQVGNLIGTGVGNTIATGDTAGAPVGTTASDETNLGGLFQGQGVKGLWNAILSGQGGTNPVDTLQAIGYQESGSGPTTVGSATGPNSTAGGSNVGALDPLGTNQGTTTTTTGAYTGSPYSGYGFPGAQSANAMNLGSSILSANNPYFGLNPGATNQYGLQSSTGLSSGASSKGNLGGLLGSSGATTGTSTGSSGAGTSILSNLLGSYLNQGGGGSAGSAVGGYLDDAGWC